METNQRKAKVLVLGSSGTVGKKIVAELVQFEDVSVRLSSRRPADVERLRAEGKDAVYLDLDRPETFGVALAGVDRLFVLTGYTVAMLAQSKTLVDAAYKAGVKHIVHLGVFAEWDSTDPHFAWHQLIESYVKASGMAWTHLHPNMFMENLLLFFDPKNDSITTYWKGERTGWVAAADIAAVAACVLREGPERHHGKDYWLSTEVATGPEIAAILSEVTGRRISCNVLGPDEFAAAFESIDFETEKWYAESGVECMRQIVDGRLGIIGSVRNDVPYVTGRPALSWKQWASEHQKELAASGADSEQEFP